MGLFLLTMVGPLTARAQEATGNGLLISPTRTEITANSGETKQISISIKNVTKADLTAKAYLNDFESDGSSGNPKLITNDRHTPYTLNGMIEGLSDLELKAGETKQVNLTLKLKDNMAPGAYFSAVRYAAVNKTETGQSQQVSLNASVAHLVFLTVPGSVVEKIELQKLVVSNAKNQTGTLFSKPSKASLTVKNLGNGFSQPFGKVSIYKGSKEVYSYDVNGGENKGMVLPNSTRVFDNKIEKVSKPGKYKAVASVAYGNGGETVNYTSNFWYMPLWFIILLVVLVLVLLYLAYYLYKKMSGGRVATKRSKR